MKQIIAVTSIIMSVIGLPIALFNFYNGHLLIGSLCLIWFSFVIYSVGLWSYKQSFTLHKQKFTLIELLAVITIMTILLSITMSIFKVNHAKSDTAQITGILKIAHGKSFGSEEPVKADIDHGKYKSDITATHNDLYFFKGATVDKDGETLLNCKYEIKDKEETPYLITVNSFTGKVIVRIKAE